jgi:SAM-dependent methyltransferase
MDWHARFSQQAGWTRQLRSYLFAQAGLTAAARILEVGCGTGAVLADLAVPAAVHGLDIDPLRLAEARGHASGARLVCGDALHLPYPQGVFDLVFCHYLLLWVGDPLQALLEMKRVTRPGGAVLALAEPDHTARIDRPLRLARLGRWQTRALQRQGADPGLGGKLAGLFRQAGLSLLETGTLQTGPGSQAGSADERELEWAVLESDLAGRVRPARLERLKRLDERAWRAGRRRLVVPTYFAWGRVGPDGIILNGEPA